MSEPTISRRSLLKAAGIAGMACAASIPLAACGSSASSSASAASSSASAAASSAVSASTGASSAASASSGKQGKSIVVFFSRAGETDTGEHITEGNTAIVAHMIAGKIVSDVFEIVPSTPYPEAYDACLKVAVDELQKKARPVLAEPFTAMDEYDTVYLGYPIWCEDLPMIVYSFVESQNWAGKTVAPFCTYGSSGVHGTDETLKKLCSGATVTEAFGIKGVTAQHASDETNAAVNTWLAKVRP